jgi:hypothetical protein
MTARIGPDAEEGQRFQRMPRAVAGPVGGAALRAIDRGLQGRDGLGRQAAVVGRQGVRDACGARERQQCGGGHEAAATGRKRS